jgi:hypothetical protein
LKNELPIAANTLDFNSAQIHNFDKVKLLSHSRLD